MSQIADNKAGICVVGLGAATSVGATAVASAAAVRAGISMFEDHPYMINQDGDPFVVASAPYLDEDLYVEERFAQLALTAIPESLAPLDRLEQRSPRIATIVGLPSARPGLPADIAASLSTRLAETNALGEVSILPNGHSAGLMAIEAGCQMIERGFEFCLAGGVDSYMDADTLDWIEECDQLHKSTNAWGFVPGEAAGFCLLCSCETAALYELPVWSRITSIGTEHEKNRIKTDTVCIGEGLTRVVRRLSDTLPSDGPIIDQTICDQNGEAYRADEFGFMLARMSERFVDPSDFLAPADCWGDVGAASGPLFVALASFAANKGYGKGPYTLLWTSSEGGERSASILHADVESGSLS